MVFAHSALEYIGVYLHSLGEILLLILQPLAPAVLVY